MKQRFNEKWWYYLEYLFQEKEWIDTSLQIMNDVENKGLKVLPDINTVFQRFKLINPSDVRIVFLTQEPICTFRQSREWQQLSIRFESELCNELWLNLEDNLDYLIPQGIISLSESLTINNLNQTYKWWHFNMRVINTLMQSNNKILYISNETNLTNAILHYNNKSYKYNMVNLKDVNLDYINTWMQKEYNTRISWC